MMTFRPDPSEVVREPIHLPALVEGRASLSPLEKSLLGHLLLLAQPGLIVETGVYRGLTSAFILEFLELNGLEGKLVGFDMPDMLDGLRAEQPKFAEWERRGRLELVPGELPFSLQAWLEGRKPGVDFALLDARHDFPSVDWELKLLWPHLRAEGIIAGHDYTAEFDGVRHAFDTFARRRGACLLPLTGGGGAAGTSTLVALRRPTHRATAGSAIRHRVAGWKADMVRGGVSGKLWRAVRPLLRRDAD